MFDLGELQKIERRIRAADYLVVAQLFLKDNFLLDDPLGFGDIKPRLLGHWGSCHGINVTYANLREFYNDENFEFILGPGHGFPALNANLFIDGELEKIDKKATRDYAGLKYLCRKFSWPEGFPSHSSPITPGVIIEGGELGYSLATAFGKVLGHPEKTVAVLIGDGEFETATALASMNLVKLVNGKSNGKVLPILHLNGYKISAPTIYARKSERELKELIRGFGFSPIKITEDDQKDFGRALRDAEEIRNPFLIFESEKGKGGPKKIGGQKIAGNYLSHQIPLKNAKENEKELLTLENWLRSYHFEDLFDARKGFLL